MSSILRSLAKTSHRGDAGDTLLELLIALVIIALAVGPILGMLMESAMSSAEHRSLATLDTLLKSFAATATSHLELASAHTPGTSEFTQCASSYKLISKPSSMKAHATSAVTVFVSGFPATVPLGNFSVNVGTGRPTTTVHATTSTPLIVSQSQARSDANGNMQITFKVPTRPTTTPDSAGPHAITVREGAVSVTSTKSSGITVSTGTPLILRSPDAGYALGIASVGNWHPEKDKFLPTCHTTTTPTPSTTTLLSGVQLVTLKATSATHVSDTLGFVLRDPAHVPPSKPTPTMTVVGNNTVLPKSGAPDNKLTFVATVSVSTTPPPTGRIAWTVSGPPPSLACTPPGTSTQTSTTTSQTSTCTVLVSTSAANVGEYTATATVSSSSHYFGATGSATATVYASNGSGSMTVTPTSVAAGSTGNRLTFLYSAAAGGTFNGRIDVKIPSAWSAPQGTTPTGTGYVTVTGGSGRDVISISGTLVQVTGVTLDSSTPPLKITYDDATAPSAPGPWTFTVAEASIAGVTATPIGNAPTVDTVQVASAAGAHASSVSVALSMPSGVKYAIFAYSSQSGTGDSAAISGAAFTATPVFTTVGSQQNFGTSLGDHDWAWYTSGTGGTGTVTVKFAKPGAEVFLEVIRLTGATAVPIVTTDEGFHTATTAGTTATVSLGAAPSSGTDPELIFLSTEGDLGPTAPNIPDVGTLAFAHSTHGSIALFYTASVRQNQTASIPANWWGTIALEIHG